jgi:hypothetical protein
MNYATFACKRLMGGNASKLVRVLGAAMAVFLICAPLFSQGSQGTIQGGVFDQSGGAIAGATVTITDVARGASRNLVADAAGQYTATSLNPATYTVRAESKGFQASEHTGVQVEVGQTIRVDLVLQPGQQSQTVTVTSEAPAIDTTDATLGGTVANQSINSLPLNGRNFERLIQLRPGVVTSPGAGSGTSSTNGMRLGEDLYVVEGLAQVDPSTGASVINSSYRSGDASSLLPIDAIQEFNTEQNPKAEFGWRGGSVVDIGVKSGTNAIHGTAYAFGRDASATDAPNYFSSPSAPGVTPATLEQFGATAGGRIIKDKLFWFMGFEGLRVDLGDTAVDTVPTDVALSPSNPAKSMVDACTAAKAGTGINALSAQLAGLNPATCVVTPASSSFENLFPYITSTSNAFSPGLISSGPLNNGFIKGDYIVSDHNHISGMYFISRSDQLVSYAAGQLLPQWEAAVPQDIQMWDGAWTWTPNSTWVNDVRGGVAYLYNQTLSVDGTKLVSNPWPSGYGFNTGVTNPLYGGLPEIDFTPFTGYLGAGKRTGVRGPEGNSDFVDNVGYLRGKHAFKFGFEFMDSIYDNNSYNQANGEITFSTLTSFLEGDPKKGKIFIGNPDINVREHSFGGYFQDDWRLTTRVTLNLGLRYEYSQPPVERDNYIGNFNPNVTGDTPAIEQAGPGTAYGPLYHGDHKDFSPRVGVAWDVQGDGKTVVRAGASVLNSLMITSELTNPAPFGANFPSLGVNNSGTAINAHSAVNPFPLSGGQINWSVAGPVFPGNVPTVVGGVTYTGLTCTAAAPCSTAAVNPDFRTPYVAEWNLDIQRAINRNLTVDVAYVGNHGFAEGTELDINQAPIGAGYAPGGTFNAAACIASPAANCTPDPNLEAQGQPYFTKFRYLSNIIQAGNQDFSSYNALQVTVNERASHGLTFLAGYTYSHALDMESSSSISQQLFPVDALDPRLSYGPTNSDIRHRLTFAPTYAIPGMKSPGQMLQGWSVSGILTLQGGLPWSPVDQTNDLTGDNEVNAGGAQTWNYTGPRSAFTAGPNPIPCFGNLPNCTPAVPQSCMTAAQAPYAGNVQLQGLALAALTNLGCYVQNGGILTPPAYGTIGNASRNLFRVEPYYNVDFNVAKEWRFKERYSAQFRIEFFNLFNRADFAIPTSTVGIDPNSGFGAFGVSSTTPDAATSGGGSNSVLGSGGPRHIQFGLKLAF